MVDAVEFARLRRDVDELMDRRAIEDVIYRHARAHDRFDTALMASCYHDDGVDEHGFAVNPGPAYGDWANMVHGKGAVANLHNITSINVEIEGDVAHAESYVLVALLNPDGVSARFINGRYVDRLEKRSGTWRIALRRCTLDLMIEGDAKLLASPYIKQGGYIRGARDRSDVSYQRPLDIDAPVERL